MSATSSEAGPVEAAEEICSDYPQLVAEFDALWDGRCAHSIAQGARMDYLITLIEACEDRRGKAALS